MLNELTEKQQQVCTFMYIIRAVNKCADALLIEPALDSSMSITIAGELKCATLDVTEDELRTAFDKMQASGHISEFLEYDDIFNGIVGRAEVLH